MERIQFLRTQANVKLEVNGTVSAVDFSASQVNAQITSSAGSSVGKVTVPAAADSTTVEMEVNGKVNDIDVSAPKSDVKVKVSKDGTLDKVGLQEQAENAKMAVLVEGKVGDVALGAGNANVSMEVNETGNVNNVTVTKNTTLDVSGKAEAAIPVKVSGNATVTASTAVKVESNGDSKITLKKGAEKSDVKVTSASAKVEVKSEVNVQVTKSDNTKVNVSSGGSTVIQPTPSPSGGNSSSGSSSSSGGSSSGGSSSSGSSSSGSGTTTATQYSITVNNEENGKVEGVPQKSKSGESVTMTVTPNEGYVVGKVTIKEGEKETELKPSEDGKTYTFTMPANNVTVIVTYVKTYGITVGNDTAKGTCTVTPDRAESGKEITVAVTPKDGYQVSAITVKAGAEPIEFQMNGEKTGGTFKMPAADVDITVDYGEEVFKITKGGETSGCSVGADSAKAGAAVQITVGTVPVNQMAVVTVKNSGDEAAEPILTKKMGSGTCEFAMPKNDVVVSVEYKQAFTAEPVDSTSLGNSAQKLGEIYNYNNGAVKKYSFGVFGTEEGISYNSDKIYKDGEDFWWYDMTLGEGLSVNDIQSVSFEGAQLTGTEKSISVGNSNTVKSADCIMDDGKIRISYLFLMTHGTNDTNAMNFDVNLGDNGTIKAQLTISDTTSGLTLENVTGMKDGSLSGDKPNYKFSMPDKVENYTNDNCVKLVFNDSTQDVYYFTRKEYSKDGSDAREEYGFTQFDFTSGSEGGFYLYFPLTTSNKWQGYNQINYSIYTTDRKTLGEEVKFQYSYGNSSTEGSTTGQ